jgi:hypothetical protein
MLRDTNGVERKKEGARTQQPVTHTSVARCWVLRPFLGLRVVCMFLPIFPCLCPWGEKSQLQKSRVPFPNARRPGTRSHVAHLIAVPPGRALVNFSARAEQRHARYGRSAVALFHRLLVASRPGGAHFLVTVRSAGRTQMFWAVARPARPRSTADSQ